MGATSLGPGGAWVDVPRGLGLEALAPGRSEITAESSSAFTLANKYEGAEAWQTGSKWPCHAYRWEPGGPLTQRGRLEVLLVTCTVQGNASG